MEKKFSAKILAFEIAGLNASITWEEPDYLSSPKHISIRSRMSAKRNDE
ncbi:MAG: hypothetical protein IPI65_08195 [Bacteroidetes bacterium]|nr:hypothetical protein [Bacteroidota bacterium]